MNKLILNTPSYRRTETAVGRGIGSREEFFRGGLAAAEFGNPTFVSRTTGRGHSLRRTNNGGGGVVLAYKGRVTACAVVTTLLQFVTT